MSIKDKVVIRFSGDSGDGMQLTGSQFTHTSALMGNDFATFPDFPAEIRAPQGTVAGVSGFQVHFGAVEVSTPGDEPDVLVAMNPAALKANISDLKPGGVLIVNKDSFTELGFKKAKYEEDPLPAISDFKIIEAQITSQTKEALKALKLDPKSKTRCKNFYALGMTYFMYGRDLNPTLDWIEEKFGHDEDLCRANQLALKAGHNFADTIGVGAEIYEVPQASIEKGKYRQINGNTALAWGFILGAQRADTNLFLGSYPITPASDVLHELSKHKNFGVKTFQAEDEIAAICSAIGASFSGALGITTSSGPGVALKSEALNLAVMLELPLVVINIQRGGPSTGLPTKTEQSDLNMMMYGRNGESPLIILAAKSPSDCFKMAYEAARLTMEHMTPVVLMSDGYIANGSTPWKIPNIEKEFPKIQKKLLDQNSDEYLPYARDKKNLVREWAVAGTPKYMHRLGGLEKELETGNVSYDPENHEQMVHIRQQKVDLVTENIPLQKVEGSENADIALVSWGGTYGTISEAVKQSSTRAAHIHISYLSPFPKNLESVLKKYKYLVVCELNNGQLIHILNSKFHLKARGYNKIQGKPFKVREITQLINSIGEKYELN